MSDSDSFIQEVSDEVRRDRLFTLLRRWGWIAALAVIALVGAASWVAWQDRQSEIAAQTLGDEIYDALEAAGEGEATDALASVDAGDAEGRAIAAMILASEQLDAGNPAQAAQTFEAIADDASLPGIYREMARLKALMLPLEDADPDAQRAALETLANPGAPLRMLALEQIAMIDAAQGDTESAIETFGLIAEDAEATLSLRRRAVTMIVALGGDPGATAAGEVQ